MIVGQTNRNRGKVAYRAEVQGNTARQIYAVPQREGRENGLTTVPHRKRKEQRSTLSIPYCIFLAAASVLILCMGAYYLEQQALSVSQQKEIASLENDLTELQKQNADELNRIETSVNLEEIRDIAINELGMVYATQDNVVLYKNTKQNYVSQYTEMPEEETSFLQGIIKAK